MRQILVGVTQSNVPAVTGEHCRYEGGNPLIRFTEAQLDEIRKVSLAKVACDNCDQVTHIQRAMFDVPDPFLNPRVPCSALPAINLDLWKERVSCNVGNTPIDIGQVSGPRPV